MKGGHLPSATQQVSVGSRTRNKLLPPAKTPHTIQPQTVGFLKGEEKHAWELAASSHLMPPQGLPEPVGIPLIGERVGASCKDEPCSGNESFPCSYWAPGWVLGAVARAPVFLPLQSLAYNPGDPRALRCKPIQNDHSVQVEQKQENLPMKGKS